MKLFGYYRSSASYRIRILLNLKAIDYEYIAVLLNKGEQKHADFLARNPSGLVPVLDTGDQSLGQSLAIAEYLEERFPEPALLPADPTGRARVREMLATVACDIHPLQNLRVLNYIRHEFSADDGAVSQWVKRWISDGFGALEQLVARVDNNGRHCHGDTLSLADAWLVPQMYNARRFGVDTSSFPLLTAIDAHCREIPAFAAAAPERQPDAPAD